MNQPDFISVNTLAASLVDQLIADRARLRITVKKGHRGETLIDAGAVAQGGIEAGMRLAEICMGGLGHVSLSPFMAHPKWPFHLVVRSSNPVIACLGSQYAGWLLSHSEGAEHFFALGSGPGRAIAAKETLFEDIGYRDRADRAVLILEGDKPPPQAIVDKVAADCGLRPNQLTFIYAPTSSFAGGVQVVARVLEVALHKVHELKFPLSHVLDGMAAAPLSPPHPEFVIAMGRTNDAIIYGGQIHLFVSGPADAARTLAEELPSTNSRDYGRPFAEVFKDYNGDFYAIDPMLFSPAAVTITAVETGETFRAGRVAQDLLDAGYS
jgi:methenyltetrahydromethanopterin cyclohydrolase